MLLALNVSAWHDLLPAATKGIPENLCSSRAFLSVESRCVAVEDEGLH